jgi:hypothetical protein
MGTSLSGGPTRIQQPDQYFEGNGPILRTIGLIQQVVIGNAVRGQRVARQKAEGKKGPGLNPFFKAKPNNNVRFPACGRQALGATNSTFWTLEKKGAPKNEWSAFVLIIGTQCGFKARRLT